MPKVAFDWDWWDSLTSSERLRREKQYEDTLDKKLRKKMKDLENDRTKS